LNALIVTGLQMVQQLQAHAIAQYYIDRAYSNFRMLNLLKQNVRFQIIYQNGIHWFTTNQPADKPQRVYSKNTNSIMLPFQSVVKIQNT